MPAQPEAQESKKFNVKVVGGIAAVILVIGLANLHNGTKQASVANSALSTKPASSNAAQVNNFQKQQRLLELNDAEDRQRQAVLAAQNAQLTQEQAVPGPESASRRADDTSAAGRHVRQEQPQRSTEDLRPVPGAGRSQAAPARARTAAPGGSQQRYRRHRLRENRSGHRQRQQHDARWKRLPLKLQPAALR